MWGMKATTIPVVIGALELIKKGLEKYTKQISCNIKIKETTEDCTARNISHPTKDTLSSRIDFYLILALPPRNGLGYCVVNGHYMI